MFAMPSVCTHTHTPAFKERKRMTECAVCWEVRLPGGAPEPDQKQETLKWQTQRHERFCQQWWICLMWLKA